MKLQNGTLYIEYPELVRAGVPERTLESWKEPVKVPDPSDSRKRLFVWSLLKEKYQELVIKVYGKPEEALAKQRIKDLLIADFEANNYYKNFRLTDGTGLPARHIEAYTKAAGWLNLLGRLQESEGREILKSLGITKEQFWLTVCSIVKAEGIELPASYSKLLKKLKEYKEKGYSCLVSKRFGNDNSQKIAPVVSDWLIAQYALPIKMKCPALHLKYSLEAIKRGWPQLTEQAIYTHLHQAEIQQQWYMGRHGELEYIKLYGIQQKIKLASCRDALWFSDGTGFNFESKDQPMHRIYWVMDCYSEVVLGWACSRTETHQVVYQAAKKALQFAGAKPYEWRYDNASAHDKLQDFFSQATSKLHFACQPYRGSSKTIEPMTNRFQQQVMRKWWFYTGQNRGSRTMDSQQNAEFVSQYAKQLPTFEEILKVFEADVEEWNNGLHPKTEVSRLQMYQESQNPQHAAINALDMIDMFWVEKRITYTTRGIKVTIGKFEYEYEVLLNGLPDSEFRSRYIGERFVVKYDPDDLSYVALYQETENGLRFVSTAEPKPEHHLATLDHTDGELTSIRAFQQKAKDEVKQRKSNLADLRERTGITVESLIAEQNEAVRRLTLAERFREDDKGGREAVTVGVYGDDEESLKDL